MREVLFILGLFVVSTCWAQTPNELDHVAAEKYIVECATDWAESVVTGDISRRKVYFADDFQGTSVNGGRYDKAEKTRERVRDKKVRRGEGAKRGGGI
jgi:hypothetical protein